MKKILLTCLNIIKLNIGIFNNSFADVIVIPINQTSIQNGINAAASGDTLLVEPGIYIENINFNGKNITLGSQFILSGDTSYISKTIIDGNNNGSVVTFTNQEDSTAVLSGITIRNGNMNNGAGGGISIIHSNPSLINVVVVHNTAGSGGGILIHYHSNPTLIRVTVRENISKLEDQSGDVGGGGMHITGESAPILTDVLVEDNIAQYGGGIRCDGSSSPQITHSVIRNNMAKYDGGGIFIRGGEPVFENVIIEGNRSESQAAGVYCRESSPSLKTVNIRYNIAKKDGAGVFVVDSDLHLKRVTINENIAGNGPYDCGGGIYSENSTLNFDENERCNIYLNKGGFGNDLYSDKHQSVAVDTFTVLRPTQYHVSPVNHFTFDIKNGKLQQAERDLYVSPAGNNGNPGTTVNNPLRTIDHALSIIYADSLSPGIIHLAEGTYCPSSNHERLPLLGMDYLTLSGAGKTVTVLDAEDSSDVLKLYSCKGYKINNVTITKGNFNNIYVKKSDLTISNARITDCLKYGIAAENSYLILNNIEVIDNHDEGVTLGNSECEVENSIIKRNNSGLYSYGSKLKMSKTEIGENKHAGLSFQSNSVFGLTDVVIKVNKGVGLQTTDSNGKLKDVLIKGNLDGGLRSYHSVIGLGRVTIAENRSVDKGGGIYLADNSIVNFDREQLCNIVFNKAGIGRDLFSENCPVTKVYLDTFTVAQVGSYFAAPINSYDFSIQLGKITQVRKNLFVSPNGDDSNDGILPEYPLKTIDMALTKISADSLLPLAIHLSEGIYSEKTNDEFLPISCRSYVTISGDENISTVLDAEGKSRVMNCLNANGSNIRNLTLKDGFSENGAGAYIAYSDPTFSNVRIEHNTGVGLYCEHANPKLYRTIISDNNSSETRKSSPGGIHCYDSKPLFVNVTMTGNGSTYLHSENFDDYFFFVTSFYFENSSPIIINSIIWGNDFDRLCLRSTTGDNSITIDHSDIQGGDSTIVTEGGMIINWLNGNFNSNPFFKDIENDDYALTENSPCINAGTALFAWQGDTLLNMPDSCYIDKAPDMGAIESEFKNAVDVESELPKEFSLLGNYPNPFNPMTTISFQIPRKAMVSLGIYNLLGQELKTLINEKMNAGKHLIKWDAAQFHSGVYIYKLKSDNYSKCGKCLLLK
jgi:hypothetical protein